jgi:hypothetical protein
MIILSEILLFKKKFCLFSFINKNDVFQEDESEYSVQKYINFI